MGNQSLILHQDFYLRPVQEVARRLLGQKLVRISNGQRTSGLIVETEAYDGEDDQACHAHSGRTERNQMMYSAGGRAYVYFTYGMHWMLNCVCGQGGYPAAVLVRAILPLEGIEHICQRRKGIAEKHWCDGPAKLTKALEITGELNGIDLCDEHSDLFIEKYAEVPDRMVKTTTRVGIQYAGEPWRSKPWRYLAAETGVKSMLSI
jgi:DNA-3-methyladenine glycosylase